MGVRGERNYSTKPDVMLMALRILVYGIVQDKKCYRGQGVRAPDEYRVFERSLTFRTAHHLTYRYIISAALV
jgi:hypothetical protein